MIAYAEPTDMVTVQRQGTAPCANLANGRCTQRIHDAMQGMLAGRQSTFGHGRLFPAGAYPEFENGQGTQYVREYLPLHLPQLEHGIARAFQSLQAALPVTTRPIRILDIGSGPASVALSLDRLVAQGHIKGHFEVFPIEQSKEFCEMLRAAAQPLMTGAVAIRDPQCMSLEQYTASRDACPCDWIVMANVLSPFAQGRSVKDYCDMIHRLLNRHRTDAGYPALTTIEGSCSTYVTPYAYMRGLAEQFKVVCELGLRHSVQLDRPEIRNCRFYRSRYRGCKPRIIMVTVIKEAI